MRADNSNLFKVLGCSFRLLPMFELLFIYITCYIFRYIPPQDKIVIRLYTDGCEATSNHVVYLEHVQAKISLTSSFRGDVVIWLTSPMGTKSSLLTARYCFYTYRLIFSML